MELYKMDQKMTEWQPYMQTYMQKMDPNVQKKKMSKNGKKIMRIYTIF